MYYVTGDARLADVSYQDAHGKIVHVGWVRFPWKKYLHPKRGAQLSVAASVANAVAGATVGIWVNGKIGAGSATDGDPHGYTSAATVLGGKDMKMQYFSDDQIIERTEYFGQFPLLP